MTGLMAGLTRRMVTCHTAWSFDSVDVAGSSSLL
jgi:hypothetical protein